MAQRSVSSILSGGEGSCRGSVLMVAACSVACSPFLRPGCRESLNRKYNMAIILRFLPPRLGPSLETHAPMEGVSHSNHNKEHLRKKYSVKTKPREEVRL